MPGVGGGVEIEGRSRVTHYGGVPNAGDLAGHRERKAPVCQRLGGGVLDRDVALVTAPVITRNRVGDGGLRQLDNRVAERGTL